MEDARRIYQEVCQKKSEESIDSHFYFGLDSETHT